MTALKTLIFTVIVPGTVAILIPYRIVASAGGRATIAQGPLHYFGLLMIPIGALIYFWCAWDFTIAGKGTPLPIDPPKQLVVRGLYRYVRNPMYVGVLSVILSQAIWFESAQLFAYAGIASLFMHAFVVFYEERALARKFGESYEQYRKAVPRWIPKVKA